MKFMRLLCFVVIFFIGNFYVYSQSNIDKEVNVLLNKCKKSGRNADSLIFYGNQLLKLAKKHNHKLGLLEGCFAIGYGNRNKGNIEVALKYYDSALVNKSKLLTTHFSTVQRVQNNKAIIYKQAGNYTASENIYLQMKEACVEFNEPRGLFAVYNGLAIQERDKGKYKESNQYLEEILELSESLNMESYKARAYFQLATNKANTIQGSEKAIDLYHKSIVYSKKYKKKLLEYDTYNNISIRFRELKQYDSAHIYLDKILKYALQSKDSKAEHLAYFNIGKIKLNTREIDSAQYYLGIALRGLKRLKEKKLIAQNYKLISESLLSKNQYNEALIYLDSAHQISLKHNILLNQEREFLLYSKIYEAQGNHQKANIYLKKNKILHDSIFKIKTAKNLDQIIINEDVKGKEKEIESLSDDKNLLESNLIMAIGVIVVLLIPLVFYIRRTLKSKKEISKLQEELEAFNQKNNQKNNTTNNNSNIQVEKTSTTLEMPSGSLIAPVQIVYIKSDGHYVEIYCENEEKPLVERMALIKILQQLPVSHFIRSHKSFIVNLHRIKIINSTQLLMDNKTWVKMSRTYKDNLKALLHKDDLR